MLKYTGDKRLGLTDVLKERGIDVKELIFSPVSSIESFISVSFENAVRVSLHKLQVVLGVHKLMLLSKTRRTWDF